MKNSSSVLPVGMIFLVVIFMSLFSIKVQAEEQPQPSRFYGTIGIGAYLPQSDTLKDSNTGMSYGLAGGYFFHPNIAVELGLGINQIKVPTYAYFGEYDMPVNVVPISLNLVLSSPRTNDLKAFIKAGVGYYFIDWTPPLDEAKSEWILGYQMGVGVFYKFIGIEANGLHPTGWTKYDRVVGRNQIPFMREKGTCHEAPKELCC